MERVKAAVQAVRKVPQQTTTTRSMLKDCSYCGKQHRKGDCPAYGKQCTKCQKMNHFSTVYRSVHKKLQAVDKMEQDTVMEVEQVNMEKDFFLLTKWWSSVRLSGSWR